MTDTSTPKPAVPADLPLIIEQLQNQLDDLTTILAAQQEQIAAQASRISALEQS